MMTNDDECSQIGESVEICSKSSQSAQTMNHRVTLTALVHGIVEGLDTVTDILQWRRQGGISNCGLVWSWANGGNLQIPAARVLHKIWSLIFLATATLRSFSFLARINVLTELLSSISLTEEGDQVSRNTRCI